MREHLPFVDPRLHVLWIEGIGHGVFCKGPIEKGCFVEIAPVIVFELNGLPPGKMIDYAVAWEGRLAVGLGWTMLYNHSDSSNCAFSMNAHDGLLAIFATRDIEAEEQLTVGYGEGWFSSRGMEKANL